MDIQSYIKNQKEFFNSNQTKDVDYRIKQLKKLKSILKANEPKLYDAIYADFGKSEFETYMTELGLMYQEIDRFIKKIKSWSKPKRVSTGLINFPARSYIMPEPLGSVLVIGAWNYPYQLSLVPAISAIAAGNTVILKPSEMPVQTSAIIAKLINENFPPEFFQVIEGGVNETTELLKHRFDKIFFTGSTKVGKIIYEAAAKHLTPVTLELGGKSPSFVLADADIKTTAKRLVWAKFLNAGQTCVAPDYVLVEKKIEKALLEAIQTEIDQHYKSTPQSLETNYMQIINEANFDRLQPYLNGNEIYCGGVSDRETRFISPTVLNHITFEDAIMQDEIFGPILPVIAFENLDEVIQKVKAKQKPLSLYIYSKNRNTIKKILHEISFGGGAINDSMMHLSNSKLPFGGVGYSGMGSYHGKAGFDTFSHFKSILDKPFWLELSFKYAPYSDKKKKWIRWFVE